MWLKYKIILEVFAIVLVGAFTVWKWGITVYWERSDNYFVGLKQTEDKNYFKGSLKDFNEKPYCVLEGTVLINNFSIAPMHIEDTRVRFLPFKSDQCLVNGEKIETGCIVSNTASHIADQQCGSDRKSCPKDYQITIRPVDDLPLFGKKNGVRPFNIAIPQNEDVDDGMLIIIEQEIGRGCIKKGSSDQNLFDKFKSCKVSQALIVDTKICGT